MMEFISQMTGIFQKGGLVMYPLLICSILVVAITIERWQAFRDAETDAAILIQLENGLNEGHWQEAIALCRTKQGLIPAIISKVAQRSIQEAIVLQNALEGAAALSAARLRDRLHYLETVVTLAPLLGLLGTVIGMIGSFNVLNHSNQPQAITGGIGEALIATAAGLCVAVIALVAHSYFMHRLDRIITDMENIFTCVMDAAGRRQ